MRDNVEADGPEDNFRNSVTVPFLDYMLNEMKTRFTDLHARTTLFPFNIENIVPYLSPPPPLSVKSLSLDPPLCYTYNRVRPFQKEVPVTRGACYDLCGFFFELSVEG